MSYKSRAGGVISLNNEAGGVSLTSSGGTVAITTPTANTINLEATPGISGITFTDGSHTVSSATQLTVTGGTIGGTTPNATLTITGGVASVSNSDSTLTISPTTGDVVASLNLSHANTWAALQQFNSSDFALKGATSGILTINAAAIAGTNTLTLPAGTTDFSATGGTSQVVKQTSSGGAFTVAQLAASDLSNGTTGSTSVVLASAPTLTNPIVGTQATTDSSTRAASTAYVTTAISNAIAGVNPAIAVQAATTSAGNTSALTYNNGVSGVGATLTGANNTALTVDGYTFTAIGQRLLVKNDTQSPSGAFNGVYYVTQVQAALLPLILTRALDYDTPSDMNNTGAIPVVNGTVNGTTSWVLTSQITTVGTDSLTFVEFSINPTTILTNTLTNTHIFVGNGSNVATDVAMSGDATLANTGSLTVASHAISYAKMQQATALTLLGNPTGSTADLSEITLGSGLSFSGTTLTATGGGGISVPVARNIAMMRL